MNWTARTLRQPATMGLFAQLRHRKASKTKTRPANQTAAALRVRLWEDGPEVPNLIGSLSGIVKCSANQSPKTHWPTPIQQTEQILGIAAYWAYAYYQ